MRTRFVFGRNGFPDIDLVACWSKVEEGIFGPNVGCLCQKIHLFLIMTLKPVHVSLKICLFRLVLVREKLMEGKRIIVCTIHVIRGG